MRTENIIGGISLFIVLFLVLYWSFYVLKVDFVTKDNKVVVWKNAVYSSSISLFFSFITAFASEKLDDISAGKKSNLMI